MKYDAFISYRHLPKDKFVAENLHKTLEAFKLPKSLYSKCNKRSIERVFRDRDELPLSSDLSEPIDAAIRDSEFLIVICTPKLRESKWCLREVSEFKALHGRDRIFAVLAEGEPWESFPEALLHDEYEEIDENGNKVIKVRDIEPLAADVRGKDFHEIKKKIKEESLRLIAPMFGLSYDDLKQRHRERQIKRVLTYASIIAGVFLIFGIVSTTMAVAIHRQNVEIKENYAQSLATESETLFREGNLYKAREKADLAMEYADSSEAEYAKALAYGQNAAVGTYVLTDCYELEDGILDMVISPDGKYIAAADGLNNVWIIDVSTGEKTKTPTPTTAFLQKYYGFVSSDKLLYNTENGVCAYDVASKEEKIITPGFASIVVSDDAASFATVSMGRIGFYDAASLNCTYEIDADVNSDCAADFSKDGKLFALAMSADDIYSGTVYLIDTLAGKITDTYPFEGGSPVSISCTKKEYAISLVDINKAEDEFPASIRVYYSNGSQKNIYDNNSQTFNYLDYCDFDDNNFFTYQSGEVSVYNNGMPMDEKAIFGTVYLCQKEADGKYILTMSDGQVLEYNPEEKALTTKINYDMPPILGCMGSAVYGDELYMHFAGMDYISKYSIPEGQSVSVVAESAEDFIANMGTEIYYFQDNIADQYAYDESIVRPDSELASLMVHSQDGKHFACYGDGKSVRVYRNGETSPLYTISANTGTANYLMFSEDGGWFVINYQNGTLAVYDSETGKEIVTLEKEFPYVFDIVNVPELGVVIVDVAAETKILDSNFNLKTTYKKTGTSMCIGYDSANKALLIQDGNEITAVPVN